MKNSVKIFSVLLLSVFAANIAYSHCQVPCGIYGDKLRIDLLKEHVTTIEKAMNQINNLSKNPSANMNQLVRWVENKDKHADEFTEIVTYYFLAQRIKIKDPGNSKEFQDYQKELTYLHQMMVFSMKAKQTTDLKNTNKLKHLIDRFVGIYFSPEDVKHMKSHQPQGQSGKAVKSGSSGL